MRATASATLDGSPIITRDGPRSHSRSNSISRGDATGMITTNSRDLTGTEMRTRTLSMSMSTREKERATQGLLEDLERAREELVLVQRECEELRMLVKDAKAEELGGVHVEIPETPTTSNRIEEGERRGDEERTRVSEEQMNRNQGDMIDRMSEAEAKQKLRVSDSSSFSTQTFHS